MALKRFDQTEQLAIGVGTAALTFTTATPGNRTYAAAGAEEGDQFWARIQHEALPAEWENCLVTIVGGTIVRSTPESSSTGAAVAFSAGNKIVSDGVPFARIPTADGDEDIAAGDLVAEDYFKVFIASEQRWRNIRTSEMTFGSSDGIVVTNDRTAVSGEQLWIDATEGPITIMLPADGTVTLVDIYDTWSTNNVTVLSPEEGVTIDGNAAWVADVPVEALLVKIGGHWRTRRYVDLFPFPIA